MGFVSPNVSPVTSSDEIELCDADQQPVDGAHDDEEEGDGLEGCAWNWIPFEVFNPCDA